MSALFSTWPEFLTEYEGLQPISIERKPRPFDAELEMRRRQQDFAQLVISDGLSISAAGRRVGITATTAVRWAKVRGLTFMPRAKTYSAEQFERARQLLGHGEEKSRVSEFTGIALGSLNRLLSSEPDVASAWRAARHELARGVNRGRFTAILTAMAGRRFKEIRATRGCGYAWLYRHDRRWLLEHLPFMQQVTDDAQQEFAEKRAEP